ncbi:MAG: AMP-binding protein [Candidatus Dormibacteria bacterium]
MIGTETAQQSLPELIAEQVERHGPATLLVTESGALSYAELDRMANATAHLLLDRGVSEGSVVMTRCQNGAAIAATWFACTKIGAVFLPLNALLSGRPLLSIMASVASSVLVCDLDLVGAVESIRGDLPRLEHVIVAGPGSGSDGFHAAIERCSTDPPALPAPDPAAPAKLMFTSGTTGEPKGVVWSRNAEALHAVSYAAELVRLEPGETAYSCLPLFHTTCQGTLLGTMMCGGCLVVDRRFDPFSFWARTREVGAVFFPYVGTIISVLGSRPQRSDDADNPVRRAMGSAAPADRWRQFEERFDLVLEDVWGQTETASCWTRPAAGEVRPGTVGRPTQRWEARLVSAGGRAVADGEAGELWMRPSAPHVIFDGYHGEPPGAQLDADGWYHTGDLLSREEGGDLVFRGRLRDAIRCRGEMIAPAAIEAVAAAHPAVSECAAVGVAAADGVEEEILLCVVPSDQSEVFDHAALHAFLRSELPRFMVPRYQRIVAELPKTPTTRVRRHLLRDHGSTGAWDARSSRVNHG